MATMQEVRWSANSAKVSIIQKASVWHLILQYCIFGNNSSLVQIDGAVHIFGKTHARIATLQHTYHVLVSNHRCTDAKR